MLGKRELRFAAAARTGVEPAFEISVVSAIKAQTCSNQRVNCTSWKWALCTNRVELRSSTVRICPKSLDELKRRTYETSLTNRKTTPCRGLSFSRWAIDPLTATDRRVG